MLTPIRVRGKCRRNNRGGDDDTASSTPTSLTAATSSSSSNRPAKRQRRDTIPNGPSVGRRRARKPLSSLERLPVEIIEQILLETMNINLPLASPYLASKLSSRQLYLYFCSKAFSPPAEEEDTPGRFCTATAALLQSSILSRRWMNLDLWKRFSEKQVFLFAEGVQLPSRLLHPPFTSEKRDLLEIWIDHGASIDWTHSTAGEVATEGFQAAIVQGRNDMVWSLALLGVPITMEMLRLAVQVEEGITDRSFDMVVVLLAISAVLDDVGRLDLFDPALWKWVEEDSRKDKKLVDWMQHYITEQSRRQGMTRSTETSTSL
ncbi:MAG: hypothetical protein M1837_000292 [Sclerophora amabilis]|nr:MAG: hypothetical protein M1837_000292 [Sclerophora amabilis]